LVSPTIAEKFNVSQVLTRSPDHDVRVLSKQFLQIDWIQCQVVEDLREDGNAARIQDGLGRSDKREAGQDHLLPAFHEFTVAEISKDDIVKWEKAENAAGYADESIKTWRSTLHLILADAIEDGICETNPATRRRNRGKRAGRSRHRKPEKKITNALGILLIAERAALLSGRDGEFVAIVLKGFTGKRFGELVGLETRYIRGNGIQIDWQNGPLGRDKNRQAANGAFVETVIAAALQRNRNAGKLLAFPKMLRRCLHCTKDSTRRERRGITCATEQTCDMTRLASHDFHV